MKLSKEELQEYCMMLPIAYYAGKPLQLEATNVSASCANIVNGSISISISQVNDMMKDLQYPDSSTIRAIVYHEVSHVILTPQTLAEGIRHVCWYNQNYGKMRYASTKFSDAFVDASTLVNIFEDERIECLARNTYMEVDFYANACKLSRWTKPIIPTSICQAFYHVIRLHAIKSIGFKWHQFYNRSRQLIVKWSTLQPNSPREAVEEYCDDVFDLYYDFAKALFECPQMMQMMNLAKQEQEMQAEKAAKNPEPEDEEQDIDVGMRDPVNDACNDQDSDNEDDESQDSNQSNNNQQQHESTEDADNADEAQAKDLAKDEQDEDSANAEDVQNDESAKANSKQDEKSQSAQSDKNEMLDDDDDDPIIEPTGATQGLDVDAVRKRITQFVLDVQDENVKKLLMQKFFIKDMHGAQMGAMHKHSGKLDVKAVGRKDWKIFKQPSMFSDGSKIGKKMHLIVVLDQSGSYANNDYATNKILASLKSAEEQIKAFEFTVLKFGNSFHVCSKNERYSDSHEGTSFSEGLFKQIDKLKRQDCANFIIFLNDGAAWTSGWWESKQCIINAMKKALDHDNCVCILDHDAYESWFRSVKNAKVIVTDKYVTQLSANVCDALSAMLAV